MLKAYPLMVSVLRRLRPVLVQIEKHDRDLGRDLVKALIARGDRVAATARNPADVADLVAPSGGRAIALRLDVTKPDEARDAVAATRERLGGLDVVVNNAGYANVASAEEIADDDFRAQVETPAS